MGWFNKKESGREENASSMPELPKIPELPRLNFSQDISSVNLPHLPSFPNGSIGRKFSQNTIKDAVSGEREDRIREDLANDFSDEMMPEPPQFGLMKRSAMPQEDYQPRERPIQKIGKVEPVFIRIDKFEESLGMLDEARKKIHEMEEMLRNIKKLKEEEDKELREWENEIHKIKGEFEKIDRDLFSKI